MGALAHVVLPHGIVLGPQAGKSACMTLNQAECAIGLQRHAIGMEASITVAEGDGRLFIFPKDVVRGHEQVVLLLNLSELFYHCVIVLLATGRDAMPDGPSDLGAVVGRDTPMVFAQVPVVGHLLLSDTLSRGVGAEQLVHLSSDFLRLLLGHGATEAVDVGVHLALEAHLLVAHLQGDEVRLSLFG